MMRSGSTALVADDDEFFRFALRSLLVELGFSEVIEAGSYDEAFQHLSESRSIALATVDLDMPGMGSAAQVRALREHFPNVRIVVVSASRKRRDILLSLAAGAHGYLPKALGVVDLSCALQIVIEGNIYVPALLADLRTEGRPVRPPPMDQERPLETLTKRQRQVLEGLIEGQSNKEIARTMKLRENTVKTHVAAILKALGVNRRSAAAAAAARLLDADADASDSPGSAS